MFPAGLNFLMHFLFNRKLNTNLQAYSKIWLILQEPFCQDPHKARHSLCHKNGRCLKQNRNQELKILINDYNRILNLVIIDGDYGSYYL